MPVNVGKIDRALRLVAGLVLILLPLFGSVALFDNATYKIVAIVIGLALVATSLMKSCPLYTVFGIRSCKR